MKKISYLLILIVVGLSIAGCSTIKRYISPGSSTTKKSNPAKQYCNVLQKMAKASKGVSQIGPGTAIADATQAFNRVDDAYSDLEKFSKNNPDIKVDTATTAYQTFKQAVPSLSGTGAVGDQATQIQAALGVYDKAMGDLVASNCPSK